LLRESLALAALSLLAALVTNDVALLLVVPFTLGFEAAAPGFDAAPVVVLEISAGSLIGCLTPTGNPRNLFLFARGGFHPREFLGVQAPWVGAAALALLAYTLAMSLALLLTR
jgi:Na+/H+ antiporter NhaD/arsenite permease-like protein